MFSKKDGEEIAARLRCGMVSVNSVISFAGIPSLPFGGVGESGFGRIHGEDGLREFTRPQAVARQRFALPIAVTSFSRTSQGFGMLLGVVRVLRRALNRSDQAGGGGGSHVTHPASQYGWDDVRRLIPQRRR